MRVQHHQGLKQVGIDPGEYYVSYEPVIISTLLGSCVAVCLYDTESGVVGMNHFLLAMQRITPSTRSLIQDDAGRYGIHAMELLINQMLRYGARRDRLQAKAFGGGRVIDAAYFNIGEANAEFATEFLALEQIPLIASSLGGDFGRVIQFDSRDYSVTMRRISPTYEPLLSQEEQRFLQKSIEKQRNQLHHPNNIHYW